MIEADTGSGKEKIMDTYTEFQLLGKILLAALLGGLVGIEREFAEKPAGLRTHMLVGSVSTLLVGLGTQIVLAFDQKSLIAADPIRILQAIVVGISFLGAGTILKYGADDKRTVEGLATSASILSVAAMGIAVALDAYILATGATFLNLIINWGLMPVVTYARRRTK
jgi:putative Mg2+ transporter-C (MgtC) family protein